MAKLTTLKPRVRALEPRGPRALQAQQQRAEGKAWVKVVAPRRMTGRPWRRLRQEVLERDHYLCQRCRRKGLVTEAAEVDHVVPLSEGGTDKPENLEAICSPCHVDKTQRESRHA